MAKFEIFKDKAQHFRFRLRNDNGAIVLASESYSTKQSCMNAIESVRNNSIIDERYDRLTASNGGYYFNLKAVNHQIIGTSEIYSTKTARENGIYAVEKIATRAIIQEK